MSSISSQNSRNCRPRASGNTYGRKPQTTVNRYLFPKSQKVMMEEALVRKREHDRNQHEYWSSATKYFTQVERACNKFQNWSSPETYENSLAAFNKDSEAESRHSHLMFRREKLRQLLADENDRLQAELASMPLKFRTSSSMRPSVEELREARERLRRERMEEQEQEAKEKMLQHWKLNNPDFRELQMKKHRQMVQKSWDQQRWEKEARRKEEQQQENERLKREAEDNALKDMVSAEQMEKKRNQVMEWKEAVLQQIQDLKAKQREEVELENTMRREREKRFILEEMEDKRRRLLEKRKNLDLGHYLQRQHRLKLRTKAAQVERELEEDRHFLQELQRIQEAQEEATFEEKENLKRELQWMYSVLTEQEAEERRRRKQMDFLFAEEAESFWSRQDSIWKEEQKARERLIGDVVDSWRNQVEFNMKAAENRSRDISAERERLQSDIEHLNREIEYEERNKEEQRVRFAEDLGAQIERREEIVQNVEKRADLQELAEKFDQWKLEEIDAKELEVTDFRRRKAKW